MLTVEERIMRHLAFWNKKELDYPLAGFRIGNYFFSQSFNAAASLLARPQRVTPEMLQVNDYLDDYERMYQENLQVGQDAFWCAEPFTGIPWMEAFLGCHIYSSEESFWAKPYAESPAVISGKLQLNYNNPWYLKFNEFINKLVKLSVGRFPIGEPIMRGPSDLLGAILGQDKLVYYFYDYPELMQQLAREVTEAFLEVIANLLENVPPFYGGYSLGFYPLWAPGKCIWFQEDLSALCSPTIYRQFFLQCDRKICQAYPYTAVHLHPASFFILDDLLEIQELKVIEINKDVGGPSVRDMMPEFRRVLEKKCLIIWGALDEEDIEVIRSELPCRGIFLNIIAETLPRAKELNQFIKNIYGIKQ
ncbi:hypothetical protein E308F_19530 [Moorella sp. E308F]|uniref:hypothetical protein n=1 Tax=Moorella sp. E308F TaxID=2572682 RepID=UPI0010FFAAAE|nr:hypothetical protein [Moorella sp. E308F]GEA15709.1 hypothetical protein E308F_19530 [Moorella sp. E308F]